MSQAKTNLPNPFAVVMTGDPKSTLSEFHLVGRSGETLEFTGIRLGHNTSHQEAHGHPPEFAPKGSKCSACRWFEVSIYRRFDTDGTDFAPNDYVVHTIGASIVPGEQRFSRISITSSAFEVIEFLTVRKVGEDPFITVQSSRALAQAATKDELMRDAYINRAVV